MDRGDTLPLGTSSFFFLLNDMSIRKLEVTSSQWDLFLKGVPQLMMSYTDDSQVPVGLLTERDKRLGLNSEVRRKDRESIAASLGPVADGCDYWSNNSEGKGVQVQIAEVMVKGLK